jgi:N-methylhydantoinase A/oxoprolinase/acetone carboxylase beta subunit
VTVESGHDPREFCLLSYGGAGGAHCCSFAELGNQARGRAIRCIGFFSALA